MDQENSNTKKIAAIIGLLVIVAAISVGVIASSGKKSADTQVNSTASTPTADASAATETTANSNYKDGTYSATGGYTSPGGSEEITVSVTLQGDKITATSATEGATDSEAKEYQSDFIGGYKSFVVGKNIDEVRLSRVSGSSLTSGGFNAAITKIKSQAKA